MFKSFFMARMVKVSRMDCKSTPGRFDSDTGLNFGELAEWTIAPVLKTGGPKGPGGSNPSLSAIGDESQTAMGRAWKASGTARYEVRSLSSPPQVVLYRV